MYRILCPKTRSAGWCKRFHSHTGKGKSFPLHQKEGKHFFHSKSLHITTADPLFWAAIATGGVIFSTLWSFHKKAKSETRAPEEIEEERTHPEDEISTIIPLIEDMPIEEAHLTFAPHVPLPIARTYPARVKIHLRTSVKVMNLDGEYKYEFWTFDGHVPGPFIRGRVGDVLDITLTNEDDSGMQHNVDLHAVNGPGGGAPLLNADYGESKHATFRLLQPGLFVYHCAVDPVAAHISNGMYGLILVEPEEGLPQVDKEFYLLQSEFYTEEKPDPETGILPYSYMDGLNERPRYVVFNGRRGALTSEEGKLKVNTGDRVRIFFGNAGPNLISSLHIIGLVMSKVNREGDLITPAAKGLQTTLVPAGGAAVIELQPIVPGNYTILDHSIYRSEKGAVAFLEASGKPRPDIYHSEEPPKPCPTCKIHP